jgi:hypothetical protein
MFLRNAGIYLPVRTASQPKTTSTCSPPREAEISYVEITLLENVEEKHKHHAFVCHLPFYARTYRSKLQLDYVIIRTFITIYSKNQTFFRRVIHEAN